MKTFITSALFVCPISLCLAQPVLERIAQAASMTQTQCQPRMHHDADEYVECVDKLLHDRKRTDATRLGIEYFGWVGALNSARISLPGAAEAADRYLRRFRKSQRALRIGDEPLCRTVPGDCTQRIARMKLMEAQPVVKTDRFDPGRVDHGGHKH